MCLKCVVNMFEIKPGLVPIASDLLFIPFFYNAHFGVILLQSKPNSGYTLPHVKWLLVSKIGFVVYFLNKKIKSHMTSILAAFGKYLCCNMS